MYIYMSVCVCLCVSCNSVLCKEKQVKNGQPCA